MAASVLFLRMRGWLDEAAPQREQRRESLLATARRAIEGWAPDDRVVLEAADGLAIVGRVPPAVALAAARRAAGDGSDRKLGIGLHQGPIRTVGTSVQDARVEGDGLDTAAALAGFEGEHPIVASQAFRDSLAAQSARQADDLRPAGELVDERLRAHALFVFDPVPAHARATRRSVLGLGGLALLLAAGFAGRELRERYDAAHQPATIDLEIRPAGEVYVDGERKGTAPPLVKLSLPPGPHTIEVRNGRFKPLRMDVELAPGENLQVSHVFASPPARPVAPRHRKPAPGLLERFKFW